MPTYDYECDGCGHAFELFQNITEPVKRKCPECGKQKLRRLIGAGAAIVFKGSGFYKTDYRSDSYKKKAESESKASPPSSESSSSPPSSESSSSKGGGGKSEPKKKDSSSE